MSAAKTVVKDGEALAQTAAERFVNLAQDAIKDNGRFSVALSGGSTPQRLHKLLTQAPLKDKVEWSKVHIFFGDERFLPPDDPDSNYYMAQETLLENVPIPDEQVHPFITEGISPETAAEHYAQDIKTFFGDATPSFDLIFLGIGPDGHTASLFPGFPQVTNPPDTLVAPVFDAPKVPPTRLTLTLKVLNAAKNVLFLVGGNSKAEAVAKIFNGDASLPAALVQPEDRLEWLLDEAAAKNLS